jgi:two-component system, cell cycle response regulator
MIAEKKKGRRLNTMSPQIDARRANINLAWVFLITFGFIVALRACSDIFHVVYSYDFYLVVHTLLELVSNVVSFCVFAVAWHSWRQSGSSRDLIISATFLAVGIFDFAHLMSYPGMPNFFTENTSDKVAIFRIIARSITAIGLLVAAIIPRKKKPAWYANIRLVGYTWILSVAVVVNILIHPTVLFSIYTWKIGTTSIIVLWEYNIVVMNALAFIAYTWRNPSRLSSYFLRIAMVLAFVSEITVVFYSNTYDIYNFINHIYKAAAYYFVLRALFETSIVRSYERIARLAHRLRSLSTHNMALYKKAKENQNLLQNTFIQLGATMASKHSIQEVFEQIVRSAAAIFKCEHVYLSLAEGNPTMLKVVAYISSFTPPDKLSIAQSFMGKVFTNQQITVIDNIDIYPERIVNQISKAGLCSMVGVPISNNDTIIGVLELFSGQKSAFAMEDALFLKAFAQHVGEAIHNAQLYERTMENYNQCSMHYDIVKNIAMKNSPAEILKIITEKLDTVMKADGTVSFIMHHRNDGLHTEPVYIRNIPVNEINHLQRMFSSDNTAWPWVSSAEEQFDDTVYSDKAVTMSILIRKRLEILPLQTGGILQGLIVFTWNDPDPDIPPLGMTLRTVAAQTAIALERAYLYENVKEMALTDALTKLPNRRQFDISLTREMHRARSFDRSMCLMMLDIDFFKKVNDTYGHLAGDQVLRQLGTLIKKHFRNTDIPARYGGEEFAVILPETGEGDAFALAETFRKQVEETSIEAGEEAISITLSVGIAVFDMQASAIQSSDQFIDAADQALYTAKQSGRNRAIVWNT